MKSVVRLDLDDGSTLLFGNLEAALVEARISTSEEVRRAVEEFDLRVAMALLAYELAWNASGRSDF